MTRATERVYDDESPTMLRARWGTLSALVRRALLEDVPLLTTVALFATFTFGLNRLTDYPTAVDWAASRRLYVFSLLYAGVALFVVLIHIVVVQKRSIRRLESWWHLVATLWAPGATLNFLLVAFALTVLMPAFLAFKQSIPLVHPFSWDPAFMEWDQVLHFGRHPYEWLQPLLGRPSVTRFLDIVYFSWIHVMWMTVVWQAWHGSRTSPYRSQFLLSFVLSWIVLGTLLATLLSSAGPVYYASVVGSSDPYAALMDYLRSADAVSEIRALRIQQYLWTAYTEPGTSVLAGISAMPSLHVAMAVLMAIFGFSQNRWIGSAYAVYACLILIGSIHLAWHYAIDGYFSLVVVAAIWWFSGRVMRWWRARIGLA